MDSTPVAKITLTPDQTQQLAAILAGQVGKKKGAIMTVVDRAFDHRTGGSVLTLSATWLPWPAATKVTREITKQITKLSASPQPEKKTDAS